MADGNVHLHPAVGRMALRRQMAAAVERLLETVDILLRELASDEPDADLEPSLGAPEHPAHLCGLSRTYDAPFAWSRGAADDREADGDKWAVGDADLEPSLGSSPSVNQKGWAVGGVHDLEREHDGREPSLGSAAAMSWSDQRGWAVGGDQDEREWMREGEGDHDEREPETGDCCFSLPNIHDQRTAWDDPNSVDGFLDPDEEPGLVVRCEVELC